MKIAISYVECSNKKCTSKIGTSHPDLEHFCSNYCGDNRPTFRLIRPRTSMKSEPVKIKTKSPEEYEARRVRFNEIKLKLGATNVQISRKMKVNKATISCYLSGKYKITDEKWDLIQEIF